MPEDPRPIGDILKRGVRAQGSSRESATASGDRPEGERPEGEQPTTSSPEHDPSGLELAARIAAATAAGGSVPRKRRRPGERSTAGRSGTGDLTPLSDAVDGLIAKRGWRREVNLKRMLADWPSLVGAANADHSTPEAYVDKVLTIRATSTAWASNLRLLAPQLVARLNAALGQGTIVRVEILGPAGPTWKHGLRVVRDGRGPRDTYG